MNRHVRSFNPDPSPPSQPQRSVQSPAIHNGRHHHHYTASSAAAVTCFVLGGVVVCCECRRGKLARTCQPKKARSGGVYSYADVWEFSSSVVGGWTGARPPRVSMVTYRGGGWTSVMTVQAASRDFRNKDSDVYSRGVGVGLASIRRERGHLKVGMGALIPSVPRVQDLP
ncbi:hypothetical protein QTP88_026212 [Uroleucon formosanum]